MLEVVKEQSRQEMIKEVKGKDQGGPRKQQLHHNIQRNQLCINGDIYRPLISATQPQDVFK